MQVTIDSGEDLDKVLEVVGALFGVRLVVAGGAQLTDDLGDQGIVKVRH